MCDHEELCIHVKIRLGLMVGQRLESRDLALCLFLGKARPFSEDCPNKCASDESAKVSSGDQQINTLESAATNNDVIQSASI